jgi:23S rRNA (cytidine1920-2'-O)/16S rRNA (cytidine1409-2'-O)-methyltransferase
MRLDLFLVERGDFESRARAQAAVREGLVRVDGIVEVRPAAPTSAGARIEILGDVCPYVSRGGIKLEAALAAFAFDASGKICLDLGASTGGFTDVLLTCGAAKVYAVDVGRGQLHPKIAGDGRVVSLEQTHAKALTRTLVPDEIDFLVCDVSFIGLEKALPPALALCGPRASVVALIKPQFEVGRELVGKGGLVRERDARDAAARIALWIETQGWAQIGLIDSPITGGDGAREFLIGAIRQS